MVFHDIEINPDMAYSSSFGEGWNTIVQNSRRGHEQRNQLSSQSRHRYAVTKDQLSDDEMAEMVAFAAGRRGSFAGFRIKDWRDYTTSGNGIDAPTFLDQSLGSGDGVTQEFPLQKMYEATGPNPYPRRIKHAEPGTVLVAVGGTETTEFTLTSDGFVRFDTVPAIGNQLTWGGEFRVPVRFGPQVDQLLSSQTLAPDLWNPSSFDVFEIIDESEWPDRFWPGGSRLFPNVTQSFRVAFNDGSLCAVDVQAAVEILLPEPTDAPSGVFLITLSSLTTSTAQANIRLADGTAYTTLAIGETISLGLLRNQLTGSYQWMTI